MTSEKVFNIRDAATVLGCSSSQVRSLIDRGELDAFSIGVRSSKMYRIRESAIEDFIKRRSTRSHITQDCDISKPENVISNNLTISAAALDSQGATSLARKILAFSQRNGARQAQ